MFFDNRVPFSRLKLANHFLAFGAPDGVRGPIVFRELFVVQPVISGGRVCLDRQQRFISDKPLGFMPLPAV